MNHLTKNMKLGIGAGHGKKGSNSIGAVGFLCESTVNREVVSLVIKKASAKIDTVIDCTIDYPTNATDCVNKTVIKANSTNLDLFISIHFNAGANDPNGNGITTGTEVYTYSKDSTANTIAKRMVDNISTLGFRNRGLKHNTTWGVLRSTKSPSILLECCFVDDKDDALLYEQKTEQMADKIVEAILDITLDAPVLESPPEAQVLASDTDLKNIYAIIGGSYSKKDNALKQVEWLKTLEINGFIMVNGSLYTVIIGFEHLKSNADLRVMEYKRLGIDCFIRKI